MTSETRWSAGSAVRPLACADREHGGYALPAVLLVLLGLTLLFTAGYQSARLDWLAALGLASSVRAFQGAEAGLAVLEIGTVPGLDTLPDGRVALELATDTLWTSRDGRVLVRHRAEAKDHAPSGAPSGRRSVSRLWLLYADGRREPLDGSWRESIRLDGP